jgi:DegV family protein with EDD domain
VIHVVTDSTSDISQDAAAALGITVVPLTVFFGESAYKDGVDLTADEFYGRLTAGEQPRTSQPSPEDFVGAYQRLLTGPDDTVISVHISGKLSGTMQAAYIAAKTFADSAVHIVDSGSVSGGLQLLVQATLSDIAAGCSTDDVLRRLETRKSRVAILVALDTLTYLQRGGRIGRAQAMVGGMLRVKPVLSIIDGEVSPLSRVRSRQQAIDLLAAKIAEAGELEGLATLHSAAAEGAALMAERLRADHPGMTIGVGELGPVVGTYAGPGGIGVAYLRGA